jgi:23S rRNA (pseudouridine1915-N3)-methyltransferase
MRWQVLAIGKPRLDFARIGIDEYAARMRPFAPLQLNWLKATTQAGESLALLERSKGMLRIVLDERGEEVPSRALAKKISDLEMRGKRDIAVIIGGADGHTDELRGCADWLWSLSRLTLQHELALLVAMEQLYRAYTIKSGLPYHRD